jgi:ZIP family zinc transporter
MLGLFLAACVTALATGLGALPVYAVDTDSPLVRPIMWGVAAGVMTVAAVQGLLLPGLMESGDAGVLGGVLAGVAFLLVARRLLEARHVHVGQATDADARSAILIFTVLFVHSLPEGMALGSSWATGSANLGLFVFLAIALQNIPEGTAAAIPLRDAGVGIGRSFVAAVGTSAPQPIGALAAYALVSSIGWLLGPSFGFAAGAMLALVVVEIAPVAFARSHRVVGVAAALASAAITVALGLLLSVA